MTRDEQINQYWDLVGYNCKPSKEQREWFIKGAYWADINPEWHSARTERPKEGETVFVVAYCGTKQEIHVCRYHECDKWVLFGNQKWTIDLWMHLPKIPDLAVMD
jgi:hypothetical protein